MVKLLVAWYLKKHKTQNTDKTEQRYCVSRLLGYIGIFFNTLLFAAKYLIGFAAGSVAIKADAINNLTDSLSNIVSILSFHIAEKPADKEHPFGHERTETISALFMGMLIVYLGFEMTKQSLEKIIHPVPYHFELAAPAVLILSIAVKLYMASYNHKYAKKYHSDLLEANAIDSRNDTYGTALILISTLVSPLIHYDLDGIMGLITAGIIFVSAWGLLKNVINTLLGEAPSPEEINELIDLMMESPMVIDVHDVAVHTYGPRYKYATAHVEVDGALGLIEVHREMDRLERIVGREMNIEMVTHVDPVMLHDQTTIEAAEKLSSILAGISQEWTFQDFRVEQHSNGLKVLFFDLIVPYRENRTQEEIEKQLEKALSAAGSYELQIRIVHPYS